VTVLDIHINGDGCWPDLEGSTIAGGNGPRLQVTEVASIAALASGMQSGLPSVMIRLNLPDGTVALGETSMRLFLQAAAAFRARYGDV
jgi:hypothetical protein